MPTMDADKRKAARTAARKARDMASKLEQAAGIVSDSERKRQASITSRTIWIEPTPQEILDHRAELETDDQAWLRYFFPDPPFGFWYEFTNQQRAMIEAIGDAILYGGDQAIAASRGEGKTAITRRLTLKYVLSGQIKFPVLFNATGSDAVDSLQAIKTDLEENEILGNYYREVCTPVARLEGVPQRAGTMLVSGKELFTPRTFENHPCKFVWCGHEIYLPNVPGSPSAGAIIATRGLDSAVRGLNKRGRRPDVAIIDDPDTEDTARSDEQAQKLEDRIDRAIAGLGGQQRGIARVMLTTLQNRVCVSYRFTDPMHKPTWKGKRFRFLLKPPDRTDLWEAYVQRVQKDLMQRDADGEPTDPFARGAHSLYLDNREAMDAGAVVANPHRFDGADLGDGTCLEVSALQRYYNLVARVGPDAVATEYDNDPPPDESRLETKLTWLSVADCSGELERREVEPTTTAIVRAVDVRKIELHDAVICADQHARYRIADYDLRVHGNSETTVQQAETFILEALRKLADQWQTSPLKDRNGTPHEADLVLIDKGWIGNWTEDGEVKTWASQPVETFCLSAGLDTYLPAKGAPNYQEPAPDTHRVIVGDHWHINRGKGRQRICDEVIWDANHWHLLVEELFLLPEDSPDRFTLFAPGGGHWTNHKALGQHVEAGARQMREQMARGTRSRKPRFVRDHWWDALAMGLVGMSILQWRGAKKRSQKPRRTLAEMAGK